MSTNLLQQQFVAPQALLREVGDLLLVVDECTNHPSPEAHTIGVILRPTCLGRPYQEQYVSDNTAPRGTHTSPLR